MKFGELIKDYRKKHDLSMQDFSDMSGLSKMYISMLERNKNNTTGKPVLPSSDTISKVAKAMNIGIDELLSMLDGDTVISFTTKIEDYKFANYFKVLSQQEEELLSKFRQLDVQNQEDVMDYVDLRLAKYEKSAKKDVKSCG